MPDRPFMRCNGTIFHLKAVVTVCFVTRRMNYRTLYYFFWGRV